MKEIIFIFIALLSSLPLPSQSRFPQGNLLIATFNIHYISPYQKKMIWEERKEAALQAVKETDPDIIGFQEMETFIGAHLNKENQQLDYLLAHLPQYSPAAVGDAESYPITQPLLYKPERLEFLEQGFFFFSETPDKIYSRTFNGSYPAFCVWVKFRDKRNNREFLVFNMHNDYKSRRNRIASSQLIRKRMKPFLEEGSPLILLGDFNALRSFKPVTLFLSEGFTIAETTGSSFHFNRGLNLYPAIDHILFTKHFIQTGSAILRRSYNGVYPSDHYPVSIWLDWKDPPFQEK